MITQEQLAMQMAMQQQQQQMLGGMPAVGASHYPPQYNFGNQYQMNRLAGGGGLLSGAASAAYGIGTGLTTAGHTLGALSMLGVGSSGMLGGILGYSSLANPFLLAGYAATLGAGTALGGLQANAQVGMALSSHHFSNPMAPGGYGYTYSDQNRMTQSIIGMGARNAFVGQSSQLDIFKEFTNLGLDKGVTSMGKLIEKFKDFSKVTEDMAVKLGKTVSEVTGYVAQLHGQGFYSARDVMGQMSRLTAASNYGLSIDQQMSIGQGAASSARANNLTGAAGAAAAATITNTLGAAVNSGFLNEQALKDVYGAVNTPEAIGQMTTNLSNTLVNAYGSNNSVFSNLLGAFLRKDSNGNYVIDSNMLANVSAGGMSFTDIKQRGLSTMQGMTQAEKAGFESNRKNIASQLLSSGQGLTAMLSTVKGMAGEVADTKGINEGDAFTLLMRNLGVVQEKEARLLYEVARNSQEISDADLRNTSMRLSQERFSAYMSRERGAKAFMARMKHIPATLLSPIGQGAAQLSNYAGEFALDVERTLFGLTPAPAGVLSKQETSSYLMEFSAGNMSGASGIKGTSADMFSLGLANIAATGGDINAYAADHISAKRKAELDALSMPRQINGEAAIAAANQAGAKTYAEQVYLASKDEGNKASVVSDLKRTKVNTGTLTSSAHAAYVKNATRTSYTDSKSALAGAVIGTVIGGAIGGAITFFTGGAGVASIPVGMKAGAAIGLTLGAAYAAGIGGMGKTSESINLATSGVGIVALSKLNSKEKLKSFDNMFDIAYRKTGDVEQADAEVAAQLSKMYGSVITSEDVRAIRISLNASTQMTYAERLAKDDYGEAMQQQKRAEKAAPEIAIAESIKSLRLDLSASDDPRMKGLKDALAGSNPRDIYGEMARLADDAAAKGFTGAGTDPMSIALSKAQATRKMLRGYAGRDAASLSSVYAGGGDALRKLIGSTRTGKLTTDELDEMAKMLTINEALTASNTETGEATAYDKVSAETLNNLLSASRQHLAATNEIAILVDNIGANITGKTPYGITVPIDKQSP